MIVFTISFVRALCLQGLSRVGENFCFSLSGQHAVRELLLPCLYGKRISFNPCIYISSRLLLPSSFDGNSRGAYPRNTKLRAMKAIAPH